ncbi:hypothetical protein HAX54_029013 [Datura stramonium]|uniref:Uncharacterized protein n=1 Tax=Datura stramonium TaxID=4076 RepID=A0ABS8SA28_DATST|nr:hypothetical protein [Datura stramonium]
MNKARSRAKQIVHYHARMTSSVRRQHLITTIHATRHYTGSTSRVKKQQFSELPSATRYQQWHTTRHDAAQLQCVVIGDSARGFNGQNCYPTSTRKRSFKSQIKSSKGTKKA